jgi:3'-phosphoadenosine 5'-phosphosulfate sulfotransferase (PAPS reductase)/FAD synthetase
MTHPPLACDLVAIFEQYQTVHISFSGGKESVVLADLVMPWRDRVVLVWVNTGDAAPGLPEFVREYGSRFRLVEINSDSRGSWKEFGPPAAVASVEQMRNYGIVPSIQPWPICCWRNRQVPIANAMANVSAHLRKSGLETTILHGQRDKDQAFKEAQQSNLYAGTATFGPLWNWSFDEVMAYIEQRQLALPPHYGEIIDSIECVSCPADTSPAKLAYLDKHFPATGRAVRQTALMAITTARAACDEIAREIDTGRATR